MKLSIQPLIEEKGDVIMNKQKWYNKTWFMWLMLIIC